MKIVLSIAEKGGVGKTAVACIVAAGLAKASRRVLLVGLDVQVSSASVFLEEVPEASGSAALLLGKKPEPIPSTMENVDVLSGGHELDSPAIRALHPDELREQLASYEDRYDVAVVDVAPVLLHLHRLALEAATIALPITDAQSLESITGLGKVLSEITVATQRRRHAPEHVIPIVNKVNRRNALDNQLADAVHSQYPDLKVMEVPVTTVVPRSIAQKRPDQVLIEASPAREPLKELVKLLLKECPPTSRKPQASAHG